MEEKRGLNYIPLVSKIIPKVVKGVLREKLFAFLLQNMRVRLLIKGEVNSKVSFCIVHYNAPDFLLLNVKQICALHPEAKIYVLDNGSLRDNLRLLWLSLSSFNNVTLMSREEGESVRSFLRLLPHEGQVYVGRRRRALSHALGLQYLLNYSSERGDEVAVFLDQDCILCRRIDELIDCLTSQSSLIIGVRDYVKIPKGYGPLRPGFLRKYPCFIHASFMILKPKQIRKIFGNYSLYHRNALHEPYHGISIRSAGKIIFLDSEMHDSIPLLTRYSWKGKTYAWHAWYSSRTVGLSLNELLDGLPVSWLRKVRKLIYDFMENLHNETLTNRRRRIP